MVTLRSKPSVWSKVNATSCVRKQSFKCVDSFSKMYRHTYSIVQYVIAGQAILVVRSRLRRADALYVEVRQTGRRKVSSDESHIARSVAFSTGNGNDFCRYRYDIVVYQHAYECEGWLLNMSTRFGSTKFKITVVSINAMRRFTVDRKCNRYRNFLR